MMSLLNRPVAADQAMMLAFSQQNKMVLVNFVNVRGQKSSDVQDNIVSPYAALISKDNNSVSISGSL